jgi:hypothetical protein
MKKLRKKEVETPLDNMSTAQLEREIGRYFNAGANDTERDAGIAKQLAKLHEKQGKPNA